MAHFGNCKCDCGKELPQCDVSCFTNGQGEHTEILREIGQAPEGDGQEHAEIIREITGA